MSRIDEVKRKGYFSRVHKQLLNKNVIQIDANHPKYVFTQYVLEGLQFAFGFMNSDCSVSSYPVDSLPKLMANKYEFVSNYNKAPVTFTSFCGDIFKKFRERIGIDENDYGKTMCIDSSDDYYLEFISNSKSGQNFFLTSNKQFLLKTITKTEAVFFLQILEKYMRHFESYPHSILVKFVGLHRIKVKKFQKPLYFVVMVNVFYPDERIERRYDIKGCLVGRFTKPTSQTDPNNTADLILKEKNLKSTEKLRFSTQRKWVLKQIDHDSKFLQEIGVLDYSLLVGIQTLHEDEKDQTFASVVTRTAKSTSKDHSVFKRLFSRDKINVGCGEAGDQQSPAHQQTTSTENNSKNPTTFTPAVGNNEAALPGMIPEELLTNTETVQPKEQQQHPSPSSSGSPQPEPAIAELLSDEIVDDATSKFRLTAVSPEEAHRQNRRLLPSYHKNELHILDTNRDRFYVGIIDFFTRYTPKKKMEHAYKSVLHPPLSFSTVHPNLYAERFRKFIKDNTH